MNWSTHCGSAPETKTKGLLRGPSHPGELEGSTPTQRPDDRILSGQLSSWATRQTLGEPGFGSGSR